MNVWYDCPDGCVWELPVWLAFNKYGAVHEGVACPRHRVYCRRRRT